MCIRDSSRRWTLDSRLCPFDSRLSSPFAPFTFSSAVVPLCFPVRAAPHSPQNLACGAFLKPHWVQRRLSAVPHSLQNFSPSGFSNPQLAQRIGFLYHIFSRIRFPLVSFCTFHPGGTTTVVSGSSTMSGPACSVVISARRRISVCCVPCAGPK